MTHLPRSLSLSLLPLTTSLDSLKKSVCVATTTTSQPLLNTVLVGCMEPCHFVCRQPTCVHYSGIVVVARCILPGPLWSTRHCSKHCNHTLNGVVDIMTAENGSVIAVYIAQTPVYKLGVGMCLYIVVYFWYMPTAWP